MTDLHKAEAAAREALDASYSGAIYRAALRDLLAALDAARGEAIHQVEGRKNCWRDCSAESAEAARKDLRDVRVVYAAPPAALAVPAGFADWLAREMPAGTVIGDPHWWANLIARRFAQFASKEPAGAMFRHKESGRTRLVLEDEADDFEEMNATWTRVGAVYLSPSIKESAND